MSAVRDGSVAPGGDVCGVCGITVESEPCAAHEDAETPTPLRECAECSRDEIDGCDEPEHEDYPLCWVHASIHCWSCSLAARDDERESGLRGNW